MLYTRLLTLNLRLLWRRRKVVEVIEQEIWIRMFLIHMWYSLLIFINPNSNHSACLLIIISILFIFYYEFLKYSLLWFILFLIAFAIFVHACLPHNLIFIIILRRLLLFTYLRQLELFLLFDKFYNVLLVLFIRVIIGLWFSSLLNDAFTNTLVLLLVMLNFVSCLVFNALASNNSILRKLSWKRAVSTRMNILHMFRAMMLAKDLNETLKSCWSAPTILMVVSDIWGVCRHLRLMHS